ncbi:protein dead ringer [Citrus sinensis]|uniref:Protein dead ringer n=1 Tax=Citrus sinensis TaxID=2711 RepID=A0ACB8IB20_CITSI|nr:protein dead ringer [Citrus sinensis]
MSANGTGCGKEEKGNEDMEEEPAPDVNMSDGETNVDVKDPPFSIPEKNQDDMSSDNIDLQTDNNDVMSVGLPSDNNGSVDNQTADDVKVNTNVDRLYGNHKDLKLESVDDEDKDSESVTGTNAPVDVIAKENSSTKSDGSLVHPLNQHEHVAAEERLTKIEAENGEKEEKLDDDSVVGVSANELSGTRNDGSHVHPMNPECAAVNESSSEIKAENNKMGEKLDGAAVFDASAKKFSGSKNNGSLNQLECATADERPSEVKAQNDEKREKLEDVSVDVSASKLYGTKNDGIESHVLTLNQLEFAERSSDIKAKNEEKGEKSDDHISKNDEKREKLDDALVFEVSVNKLCDSKNDGIHMHAKNQLESAAADERSLETKDEDDKRGDKLNDGVADMELTLESEVKESKPEVDVGYEVSKESSNLSFLFEPPVAEGDESGTEDEQVAFAKEVENFYRERNLEFKHPKFYKEDLNLLKLWRAVIKLGGYDEALLEYEKHRMSNGELPLHDGSLTEPSRIESQAAGSQAFGSGRARRDAAARAMQGWHSKRLLGSGEVCQPIIKLLSFSKTWFIDSGLLKRKKPSTVEHSIQVANVKATNPQLDTMVIDIGPPADWVKINVQRTIDCFEVYALVPGLLREEVHVQSDPAGRLVISGQPEHMDNPWGVTPFKKVVSLPSRIDPHQTSAVVTLHGQLFVRVPFEQSDM